MSVNVTDLVMLKYHIMEYDKEIERAKKARQELVDKLDRKCTHPTIKVDSKYYEGGYDYVSSVKITHTCTLCDKIVKSYDDPTHQGMHA